MRTAGQIKFTKLSPRSGSESVDNNSGQDNKEAFVETGRWIGSLAAAPIRAISLHHRHKEPHRPIRMLATFLAQSRG